MDVEVDGVPFISPPPPHPGQGLALHYESSRDEVAVQNGWHHCICPSTRHNAGGQRPLWPRAEGGAQLAGLKHIKIT